MVKDGAFVGEHSPESFTTDADEPRWLGVRQKELAVRKGKTYPGYAWVKVSEGIEKDNFRAIFRFFGLKTQSFAVKPYRFLHVSHTESDNVYSIHVPAV